MFFANSCLHPPHFPSSPPLTCPQRFALDESGGGGRVRRASQAFLSVESCCNVVSLAVVWTVRCQSMFACRPCARGQISPPISKKNIQSQSKRPTSYLSLHLHPFLG